MNELPRLYCPTCGLHLLAKDVIGRIRRRVCSQGHLSFTDGDQFTTPEVFSRANSERRLRSLRSRDPNFKTRDQQVAERALLRTELQQQKKEAQRQARTAAAEAKAAAAWQAQTPKTRTGHYFFPTGLGIQYRADCNSHEVMPAPNPVATTLFEARYAPFSIGA